VYITNQKRSDVIASPVISTLESSSDASFINHLQ
jgi:hypothetical protein